MMIELSPSQERKLHSILDRGLDTLNEFTEKQSSSLENLRNIKPPSQNSSHSSQKSPIHTEKSEIINSELKTLQSKLAFLEAKLAQEPKKMTKKSKHKFIEDTPRSASTLSRKLFRREWNKKLEKEEKEIERLGRRITSSPTKLRTINGKSEKNKLNSVKRGNESVLKKENEVLRVELRKMKEIIEENERIREELENLMTAFEKSERIRKKQRDVIVKLKEELKTFL